MMREFKQTRIEGEENYWRRRSYVQIIKPSAIHQFGSGGIDSRMNL
jgi:hypothetical protein